METVRSCCTFGRSPVRHCVRQVGGRFVAIENESCGAVESNEENCERGLKRQLSKGIEIQVSKGIEETVVVVVVVNVCDYITDLFLSQGILLLQRDLSREMWGLDL
uniref:Uncharacterized protein n=1 Tax=Cacopsylla melanoneura TaxID=428564 RepID=A0A8D8QA03_9HEMI